MIPKTLTLMVIIAAPALSGCMDDRCDPGQVFEAGACVASLEADAQPAGKADAQPADMAAALSGLGDVCQLDGDCVGQAGFCALQPGTSEGYCSVSGCAPAEPSSCPDGYYCFDLSVFDPTLPTFCARK